MKLQCIAALLSLASLGYSQTAKYCAPDVDDVCYQVNIPEETAREGNGDIYFQIKGPASMQWVALGQGNQMAGSNIFVVYAAGDGKNVTVSPRSGQGHFEPEFNSEARVALLDGSGISNGMMTANVRCSNCRRWDGGELQLTSSNSDWIWAARSGDALNSNSQSEEIERHSDRGSFNFDLTTATGGSSTNPFVGQAAAENPTNTASAPNRGSSGQSSESDAQMLKRRRVIIAHGVLMSLAFVIFYPLGAILIRLLHSKRVVLIHAGTQLWAFSLALAGLGLGIWFARSTGQLNNAHPIIGIIVISLLFLAQAPLGIVHHALFKKHERRTVFAHVHIWLGRALITLGIINGGLGFQLAGNTTSGEIAYGVIAAIVWFVYLGVIIGTIARNSRVKAVENEKREHNGGTHNGGTHNGGTHNGVTHNGGTHNGPV